MWQVKLWESENTARLEAMRLPGQREAGPLYPYLHLSENCTVHSVPRPSLQRNTITHQHHFALQVDEDEEAVGDEEPPPLSLNLQ